jgi:hypothetical protein
VSEKLRAGDRESSKKKEKERKKKPTISGPLSVLL